MGTDDDMLGAFLRSVVTGEWRGDLGLRDRALEAIGGRDAASAEQWALALPEPGRAMALAACRIAHDGTLSSLAGNPALWPWTVAYLALGGRISGGVVLDADAMRHPDWSPSRTLSKE